MKATKSHIDSSQWVDLYADELYYFALKRTGNQSLAEDLVQDTFFSALKASDNFEGKSKERTWLYSILKNKIIDHYRKASTKNEIHQLDNDDFQTENYFGKHHIFNGDWVSKGFVSKTASHLVESNEFYQNLENCLSKISYKAQMSFRLKHLEDVDTDEICKELEISSSNYWVLLHRARLQLRDCLSKKY